MEDNELFLYKHHTVDGVMLAIGSRKNKRSIALTDNEALDLAYRLMSLARGGETHGFELFKREQ